MAEVSDAENTQRGSAENKSDADDARVQELKQAINQELINQSSNAIKDLETSRQHSEERLGVLLLINYTSELDALNSHYGELVSHPKLEDYGVVSRIVENYSK
jgi:hypothetical protein